MHNGSTSANQPSVDELPTNVCGLAVQLADPAPPFEAWIALAELIDSLGRDAEELAMSVTFHNMTSSPRRSTSRSFESRYRWFSAMTVDGILARDC
jgi:hypothetical protein